MNPRMMNSQIRTLYGQVTIWKHILLWRVIIRSSTHSTDSFWIPFVHFLGLKRNLKATQVTVQAIEQEERHQNQRKGVEAPLLLERGEMAVAERIIMIRRTMSRLCPGEYEARSNSLQTIAHSLVHSPKEILLGTGIAIGTL